MAKKRIARYSDLNLLKKQMIASCETDFNASGLLEKLKISFEPLLREILLDTDQCMSNSHLFQGLGPSKNLDDENGNAGYDTEVYIMENFSYCFPYGQSYKGPIKMNEFVAHLLENPMKVSSAVDLLMHSEMAPLSVKITQYLLRVFTVLCQSFNDELDYIKFQLVGKETFGYIRAFAQHRHNSVLLMKKLLQNSNLFKNVILVALQQTGLIDVVKDGSEDYKPQFFMATLLDYIWI